MSCGDLNKVLTSAKSKLDYLQKTPIYIVYHQNIIFYEQNFHDFLDAIIYCY